MTETAENAATRTRDPLEPFMKDIAVQIIRPHIQACLDAFGNKAYSQAALHTAFKERTGSGCSMATFRRWLVDAGFQVNRTGFSITG